MRRPIQGGGTLVLRQMTGDAVGNRFAPGHGSTTSVTRTARGTKEEVGSATVTVPV